MFEPVRGGTRGGQAEFKWSDVAADKDREHYLGHSINAPAGRWQKNKDIHWYNRDQKLTDSQREEEVRKIKELEADALAAALGFKPTASQSGDVNRTGAAEASPNAEETRRLEKEERRRRKVDRREQKRARKEVMNKDEDDRYYQRRSARSRSRSPQHRHEQERAKGYRNQRHNSSSYVPSHDAGNR
jgi:hypothetical protein